MQDHRSRAKDHFHAGENPFANGQRSLHRLRIHAVTTVVSCRVAYTTNPSPTASSADAR